MFLGVDPGRQKFGWALTEENGNLCASGIVSFEQLDLFANAVALAPEKLCQWRLEGELPSGIRIRKVFCGDGTGHAPFLRSLLPQGIDVELIKERNTTLNARALYWKLHPPLGLWRLVPLSLRVPPRPIDDLAACCIVHRALQN
jgi:RNase H-fold protein (predicted Holliday junction resolvase)